MCIFMAPQLNERNSTLVHRQDIPWISVKYFVETGKRCGGIAILQTSPSGFYVLFDTTLPMSGVLAWKRLSWYWLLKKSTKPFPTIATANVQNQQIVSPFTKIFPNSIRMTNIRFLKSITIERSPTIETFMQAMRTLIKILICHPKKLFA